MAVDDAGGEVFAERLLVVIDEGKRTATYKLALLLALIDACAAQADDRGRAPTVLHTRTIAHHVLEHLPQARTYLIGDSSQHLDQITSRRSALFRSVFALHLRADATRCAHSTRSPGAYPTSTRSASTWSRKPSPAASTATTRWPGPRRSTM